MITENTNLGYCCINMTLQKDKKNKITTNRSMIKRTFADRGITYASELAVDIAEFSYKKKRIVLDDVELKDTYFNLQKYQNEVTNNLQFIIDHFNQIRN